MVSLWKHLSTGPQRYSSPTKAAKQQMVATFDRYQHGLDLNQRVRSKNISSSFLIPFSYFFPLLTLYIMYYLTLSPGEGLD